MSIYCPFCEDELILDQSVDSYYCYCGKSSHNSDNLTFFYGSKDIFTLYINFQVGHFSFDWYYDRYSVVSVDYQCKITWITEQFAQALTPEEALKIFKRYIQLKVFA